MSKIYKNSPSVVDLADGEIDFIAGGNGDNPELLGETSATHTRMCRVDSNGDGWCFLKED